MTRSRQSPAGVARLTPFDHMAADQFLSPQEFPRIVKRLIRFGKKNPTAFYQLYARVLSDEPRSGGEQ